MMMHITAPGVIAPVRARAGIVSFCATGLAPAYTA